MPRPSRSVLVEHRAKYQRPVVHVGDEVVLCLPTAPADAEVTCTLTSPDGESQPIDVRRRESELFADHVAVLTVDADGKHRYRFTVDGRRHSGSVVVRAAQPQRGRGRRK